MPNHAAYKRADVEDARRGRPMSDLTAYARDRGLDPIGRGLVGHVAGLNPRWEDYVFNVMRGEVGRGRFGVLQHELHEIGLGDDGKPRPHGTYYGLRASTRMTWKSFLPFGELFEREAPDEPFQAQSIWLPTTSVALMLPEAALVPALVVTSKDQSVLMQKTFVDGFTLGRTDAMTDQFVGALANAWGPTLSRIGAVHAIVTVRYGQLGLRVDGFRDDPAELDHLRACAGDLADALAARCHSLHESSPVPFETPLADFDAATHPAGYHSYAGRFDDSALQALRAFASERGMRVEDPVALHRRFPRLPIPGTSLGLLAGPLPGTSTFGRVTFNSQGDRRNASYVRRGVMVEAAPDAQSTPLGGVRVDAADCWVAVQDGVACAWPRAQNPGHRLDIAELTERSIAALRATGAAAV